MDVQAMFLGVWRHTWDHGHMASAGGDTKSAFRRPSVDINLMPSVAHTSGELPQSITEESYYNMSFLQKLNFWRYLPQFDNTRTVVSISTTSRQVPHQTKIWLSGPSSRIRGSQLKN